MILAVWIWWLVHPAPIPKGGDWGPAFMEVVELAEEAGPHKNYFTRKIALLRMHLRVNQLSDYPESELMVDPIKQDVENQLFSRKEWLEF